MFNLTDWLLLMHILIVDWILQSINSNFSVEFNHNKINELES